MRTVQVHLTHSSHLISHSARSEPLQGVVNILQAFWRQIWVSLSGSLRPPAVKYLAAARTALAMRVCHAATDALWQSKAAGGPCCEALQVLHLSAPGIMRRILL